MNNDTTSFVLDEQEINEQIYSCLNVNSPKSFFLFAGAGSGKTRSLVKALERFKKERISELRNSGKKIAVITYTNAACDEIKRRLDFDTSFHISTVHSFAWEVIKTYTHDIKAWLVQSLENNIRELKELQSTTRNPATKTHKSRERQIEQKTERLRLLPDIKKFTYNPNGDNADRDSLSHTEVINISAHFIEEFPTIQNILVGRFPILLIDESQDTNKKLVDAFFKLQRDRNMYFSLGMFGDTMQRIYTEGKPGLSTSIPDSWKKPAKRINYRCPKRIVRLINNIRSDFDEQTQEAAKCEEGYIRLFIVNRDRIPDIDRILIENKVKEKMAKLTKDESWEADVKVLTLEHHMAARRGGFLDFFKPLYAIDKFKTGLLDGTLQGIYLFAKQILPIIKAKRLENEFAVCREVIKHSPLVDKKMLQSSEFPLNNFNKAERAVIDLYKLWSGRNDPSLLSILKEIHTSKLFRIPDILLPIAEYPNHDGPYAENEESSVNESTSEAWRKALMCPFSQFEKYVEYISDESPFGTHQGIKGLQFPRVMVILDDKEAKGFSFSYDKLFGARTPSSTDIRNQTEGKETSIDRTRRLFYVTCSRAEKSLAIVAYTSNQLAVKHSAIKRAWFEEEEIVELL